jgi:hypothetical protein
MLLRDLLITIDDASLLPAERTPLDFARCCYHVVESFLIYLTQELDGRHFLPEAGKVVAMLVDEDNKSEYWCCESVAFYPIRNMDLHQFFSLSESEQDVWLLDLLSNAVREVANLQGVSSSPVGAAVKRAETEGLLLEYPVQKLCKSDRSRKLRFNVVRRIQRGDEAWLLRVCDRSGAVLCEATIADSTNAVTAAGRYHSSRWKGDVFQILDRRKRITFRKSVKRFDRFVD